jgi:hypothetical protein
LSHSVISHWETGRRIPTPEDVASLLTAMRVIGTEKQVLIELARNAGTANWFNSGTRGVSLGLGAVIESERAASSIFEWSSGVVPGLLQSMDYTPRDVSLRRSLGSGGRPRERHSDGPETHPGRPGAGQILHSDHGWRAFLAVVRT